MCSGVAGILTDGAEDVVRSALERGVKLSKIGDQLRYKTPVNDIGRDEIERIKGSTNQILNLLRSISGEHERGATSSQRIDYAPLAFSQHTHWNLHQLRERQSLRVVAPAIRLNGVLNISALKRAIEAMVRRHEALRTRIGLVGGVPIQVIPASIRWKLRVSDLTPLPVRAREVELRCAIERHVLQSIDATRDPLFSPALIKLSDDEQVLILAMDHLISDGTSVNILLREFFEVYECETQDRRVSLPTIDVQFPDYAIWQKNMYASWLDEYGPLWARRLAGYRPMAFPKGRSMPTPNGSGLGFVRLRIDPGLRTELEKWSRARKTTMVLCALSAFVAVVLRWYETSEAIVQYQVSGRYAAEVQNTLGYFAFRLFLRIRLNATDTFIDLLNRVQEEFLAAYEHKEFSSMQAYAQSADVTRSPCFNWFALDSIEGKENFGKGQQTPGYSIVRYADEMTTLDDFKTDAELMTLVCDAENELKGTVQFSREAACFEIAERFARNYVAFIQALILKPHTLVMEMNLV